MERIGLFGGTFDPVHRGHLAIAEQAAEELRLDQLLFIPAADPPHKRKTWASYAQRVAMLELALADHSRFSISLIEAELPAPSYTVDTLLELRKRLTGQFYFLIGADSLLELHLWHRHQKLLQLTNFVVISRPGIALDAMRQAMARLPGPFLPDAAGMRWRRVDGAEFVFLINRLKEDISSSAIREQLRRGEKTELLDGRVMGYIERKKVYKDKQQI
ncbi:nicotinate-nucleotide adenylyltransferase [Candidatus Electronema sp. JM]|uniref:nicotinate-nucleotide adenylyltransferase n=1 Tax=Candidatus Electronema sp. JM TaxID=3401571 RepID=UPI003AA85813